MTDNKLEQITADGTTIEIDDVEFDVKPLTMNEFLKAQIIGQNKDQGKALLHMLYQSLDEEDISKDDLRNAPAKLIGPLQEAVEDVNDFGDFFDEDEKQEALNKLQ